ncbi:MAG: 6-pyruvoyl trahydropterin synthase family protein [Acidobacteriota bacterium]
MADYLIRVRARFEAAHHLTSYEGKPEPNHGHSWRVEAVLRAERLDDEGMGVDFIAAKRALDSLVGRFHHRDLNAVPPFDRQSPTTEHVAAWLCAALQEKLPAAQVAELTLWEGPDCAVTYRPGGEA